MYLCKKTFHKTIDKTRPKTIHRCNVPLQLATLCSRVVVTTGPLQHCSNTKTNLELRNYKLRHNCQLLNSQYWSVTHLNWLQTPSHRTTIKSWVLKHLLSIESNLESNYCSNTVSFIRTISHTTYTPSSQKVLEVGKADQPTGMMVNRHDSW